MKQKKIPMRTCVVTKEKYPKKELIRIVKDNEGNVCVDLTGKKKLDLDVIALARKTKALDKNLEINISDDIYTELENMISK